MYKIAAVGDKDSIYGFASLGLEIFPVENAQQALSYFRKFADEKYAVVFITEPLAAQLSEEIGIFSERIMPAFIPIPAISGNNGIGMKNVSKYVEQAVGSDIIS